MSAWLTIIGVGDDGLVSLAPGPRALIGAADIVVGSRRILEREDFGNAETHIWTSPFEEKLTQIENLRGKNVVVLATGNPMYYGVGARLARHFSSEEMTVIPAPSAFSLAAARLKWPLQGVETISLHGRPVSLLHPFVQPGAKVLALTAGGETVQEVARLLRARGFGQSILTVLEHMGGPYERIVTLTADDCGSQDFADFNTLAIECIAGADAKVLPCVPGLLDEAFTHDGQLTKREVRAITLSALGPTPQALLWDVGAGCGSVAIEWMRAARGAQAIAFEQSPERIKLIADNAVALGAPELEVVAGDAEQTLQGHLAPSAIFLGGAVTNDSVFETCWAALPPGGRLVANAVTLEGEAALIARHEAHGGELVRIGISHVARIGTRRALKPRMAVMQWRVTRERAG
ncbi:MAG: precorrin-6y C5,15-methyltransferase (decarboxylating) subunit CbiE [Alphaproteobacteria bacterium]